MNTTNTQNHNKHHKGEKSADVDVQIRLYPLKKDSDDDTKESSEATISVIVDDTKKGTDDNLYKVSIPYMDKLELEAETWISNIITLNNAIFERKGWTGADHLMQRFQKYQRFLRKRALIDFMSCQTQARKEILDSYNWDEDEEDERDSPINTIREKDMKEFLSWLELDSTLQGMGYLLDSDENTDETYEEAKEQCFQDFEQYVYWYMGQKLFKGHRSTYTDHKKYFMNFLSKPYDESIVDFNNKMREYATSFAYLQPPSRKNCSNAADALWEKRKLLEEEEIREAIFDALPKSYRDYINTTYDQDYQSMEEIEFLEAMTAYEVIDDGIKKEKSAARARQKEANKQEAKKRDTERKAAKRSDSSSKRDNRNQSKRPKRHCSHCEKAGRDKYWTHNTEDCGFLKRESAGEAKKKESNTLEELLAATKAQAAEISKLKKKLSSYTGSESD